jgi:hypothetical protein
MNNDGEAIPNRTLLHSKAGMMKSVNMVALVEAML